ncbi:uncharacterized protein HKW66_Vig0038540 [Vigna angularis]|uniref:Uncharacterized protein n=1 Tax=Phaseolus angularis TaxID=3914 RepID=A0A8T0LBS2_PHAAN|nr:uncharacterized protein HKW66_Vig0038540 [Vigna angularis]
MEMWTEVVSWDGIEISSSSHRLTPPLFPPPPSIPTPRRLTGFVVIVLNNFQDQLVFYITPTNALEKFVTNPSKARFRLEGLVLEGSVVYPASKPEVEFVTTDLITDIVVQYEGSLSNLFRERHFVVAEGIVKPFMEDIKRLRGLVLEGSVVYPASTLEVEFVITDLITDIVVRYEGSLPDLFRERHFVVAEGIVKLFTKEIKRLGGLVLKGNMVYLASKLEVEFVITDLITDIVVRYEGSLPDLFRERNFVVAEGKSP